MKNAASCLHNRWLKPRPPKTASSPGCARSWTPHSARSPATPAPRGLSRTLRSRPDRPLLLPLPPRGGEWGGDGKIPSGNSRPNFHVHSEPRDPALSGKPPKKPYGHLGDLIFFEKNGGKERKLEKGLSPSSWEPNLGFAPLGFRISRRKGWRLQPVTPAARENGRWACSAASTSKGIQHAQTHPENRAE